MDALRSQVVGLAAQGAVFLVGLCLSILVGLLLAAHTEGPGSLLGVTIVSGAGLLGAAVLSQIAHDLIVYGSGR